MTPPTRAYVRNLGPVRVLSIDATHARVLTRQDLTYLVHRDRLSIRK